VEADIAAKKAVAAFAAARLTLARTVPTTPASQQSWDRIAVQSSKPH
jgi:hypothetical protein